MKLTNQRKAELKHDLAVMIDLAWRSGEFCPEVDLSEAERDYVQGRIDNIIGQLME